MHITPHKDGIACSVIYKSTSLLGAKDNNEKITSIDIIIAEYKNISITITKNAFFIFSSLSCGTMVAYFITVLPCFCQDRIPPSRFMTL